VQHQKWPDMSSPEAWDTIKVLRGGDDIRNELNKKSHSDWIRRVLTMINLFTTQTTHLTRKSGSILAELCGVVENEVGRFSLYN
jgi:hypothetical protein